MNRWHVASKNEMDGDWRLEGKERSVIELKDLVLSDDLDNGNTPMPTYACCDPDSLSYDAQCLSNPYCYCDSQGCMYPDDSNSNYGARSY